jgi:hypothetical protein
MCYSDEYPKRFERYPDLKTTISDPYLVIPNMLKGLISDYERFVYEHQRPEYALLRKYEFQRISPVDQYLEWYRIDR